MRGVGVGVAALVSLAAAVPAAAAGPPAEGFLESMDPTATNLSWGEPARSFTAYSTRAPDGSGRFNFIGITFSDFTLPGKVDSIAVESVDNQDVPPPVWYTNGAGVYRATGIPFSAPN